MKQTLIYVASVTLSFAAFAMPFSAQAIVLSFGGRIVTPVPVPCVSVLGPAFWYINVPALGDKIPNHVYVVGTPLGRPPTHGGQEVLGLEGLPFGCCPPPAFPTSPVTCQLGPAPTPALLGVLATYMGVSI